MWSYWERNEFIGRPDLVIVGSGIVGLNAAIAYQSRFSRAKVMVIEAGHLPSGASTKNAGFACFGSPGEILVNLKENAEDEVFKVLTERWRGLQLLREMLGDDALEYETPGAYELFLDQESFEATLEHLDFLNRKCMESIGIRPFSMNRELAHLGLDKFTGSIKISGEGQLNTGKLMRQLINKARNMGIEIINGLRVEKLEDNNTVHLETRQGHIEAHRCIVATNGFARQLLSGIDIEPARAQVLVTAPVDDLPFKGTFHFDQGYYYFRNIGKRILFGGGRNLSTQTENTDSIGLNAEIQSHLDELLSTYLLPGKRYQVEQRWSGIMGMRPEKSPKIEKVSPNVVCAVGLGGMGIAIGTSVGQRAVEELLQE